LTEYKHVDAKLPQDKDSAPIQVMRPTTNHNGTATTTPSNGNALPTGTQIVMVSATEAVWVKFGASGDTVTAGDTGAVLIPGGGVSLTLLPEQTHVSYVRAGASNSIVSFSKMV